jgi:hypothetical protein
MLFENEYYSRQAPRGCGYGRGKDGKGCSVESRTAINALNIDLCKSHAP